MFIIALVSETYLKEHTPLSNNISIELLNSNVEFAQEAYVQDILGTNLYNDIQAKYLAHTLSPDEQTLVSLIKPYLAYKAAEVALPFANIQIRAKGLNKLNSENTIQGDLADMRYLKDELSGRSEFLAQRLLNYLCNNSTLFPLYVASNEDITPNGQTKYECDLYFSETACGCLKCGSHNDDDCGCY